MEETEIHSFADFHFDAGLQEGLDSMGFREPTPIQKKAIPAIMAGRDLIACAQTGTGKTAAYLLPVLNAIVTGEASRLNTLILAPTRELAQQIDQQIEGLSYFISVSSLPIFGGGDGRAWDQQKRALMSGADVIAATPGRLIALIQTGDIDFSDIQHLVLDDADRMLDMGFYDDIMRIIHELPKERQTLLFSATMPPKIRSLAKSILKDPVEVTIAVAKPAAGIRQAFFQVFEDEKYRMIEDILKNDEYESVIVFANRKETARDLALWLKRKGFNVEGFHSDLEQKERESLLLAFANRQVRILVGTDILSRGIDVEHIDLVINYDSPKNTDDYVHRIGRTARAERTGTAFTLVSPEDARKFEQVQKLIGMQVERLEVPEHVKGSGQPSRPAQNNRRGNGPGGRRPGGGRNLKKGPKKEREGGK